MLFIKVPPRPPLSPGLALAMVSAKVMVRPQNLKRGGPLKSQKDEKNRGTYFLDYQVNGGLIIGTWRHHGQHSMDGLRINDQKNAIAVTMIIVTAFKICISHRKNGFLNRPNTQVSFPTFLVDFT
jgi:hypothetical protein